MLFVWFDECETSFLSLKELLTTAPITIKGESFTVYYDASHVGLGCVVMQRGRVLLMLFDS